MLSNKIIEDVLDLASAAIMTRHVRYLRKILPAGRRAPSRSHWSLREVCQLVRRFLQISCAPHSHMVTRYFIALLRQSRPWLKKCLVPLGWASRQAEGIVAAQGDRNKDCQGPPPFKASCWQTTGGLPSRSLGRNCRSLDTRNWLSRSEKTE